MKRLSLIEILVLLSIIALAVALLLPKRERWEWKNHDIYRTYKDVYYDVINSKSAPEESILSSLKRKPEVAKKSLIFGRFFINSNNSPDYWTDYNGKNQTALFAFISDKPENGSVIFWSGYSATTTLSKEHIFKLAFWTEENIIEITPDKIIKTLQNE